MVALLVGVAVMMVVIAAILPLASAETQRDKEEELIFRGRQFAEGIRNFRRKYGRYPNTLKEMYEIRPRVLRKLWKDPITNSDDWGIVGFTTGAPLPGQRGPSTLTTPPGSGASPQPTPSVPPTPTPSFGFKQGTPGEAPTIGPITGVYSKSRKKAYRIYQGRDIYADWRFTEQSLLGTAGPGSPVKPGPGVGK